MNHVRRFLIPLLLVLSVLSPATAAAQQADTAPADTLTTTVDTRQWYRFNYKQLIAPAALVAVGGFGVSYGWFCKEKRKMSDRFADWRGDHHIKVDDYLQYLPAAAYLGLGPAGVSSRHGIVGRLLAGATATVALGIMTEGLKLAVDEERPDGSDKRSFPSGHTAKAFAGAELMRLEYGLPYAIGAYTVATGVAFLRMYNGRHWLNDVLAGAGIGILSARIGYWMLPLYQKWFNFEKPSQPVAAAMPYYNPAERSAGLALTLVF